MTPMWILAGVGLWLAVLTFVIALCAASGRADAAPRPARRPPRRAHRSSTGHVRRLTRV